MSSEAKHVKLLSGDGFSFILDKKVAEQSATIRNMLDMTRSVSRGDTQAASMFTEALTNEIKFPEIKGKILEKLCQYLIYKHRYSDEESSERVPEFDFDLEISLELLVAADYLDC
ncbi:elongin C [Coemansia erecta]|uniref:Elongin-C n=1 Tax=Coemansia asiatica TaxID=1052880 RepID=A0A9W7XFL2_9FUNG|nr:elongin C [Coemansia asiatica]KAJ2857102.1 elongin C [Coemansia erecta]